METIGKYKVVRELGSGSFGKVYLCQHPILKGKFAIKVFELKDKAQATQMVSTAGDPVESLKQRFTTEAQILNDLPTHPNIISLKDIDHLPDGTPYFVMPYIAKTLADEIGVDKFFSQELASVAAQKHPRKLPIALALEYLVGILNGLAVVHNNGVIHRDMKPSNILLDESKSKTQPILCDFGIAKSAGGTGTNTNTGMGSKYYVSQEQALNAKNVTAASDVHSVGILAYRMLSGKVPQIDYKPLPELVPEISEALSSLILESMAHEPSERPKDATAFLNRLKQVPELAGSNEKDESSIPEEKPGNTDEDDTDIDIENQPTLDKKFEPLNQAIKAAWLNDGEIDSAERKQLEVMASVVDLTVEKLDQLIQDVYEAHKAQISPIQKYLSILDQNIEEQITQETPALETYLQNIFLKEGQRLGWDENTVQAILEQKIGKKLASLPLELDRFKQVKEEPPIISKEQNQFIENGSADDTYVPPLDKTPPLKEELEPLYQAIMSAWLNDGEIDEIELERINVSAASLDLEGEKLSAFIQQVYKEHESIIKPVQSYIRLLDQRIDEQITQASPLLSEQLQTLFIDSAKNLGWDEATAKETIQRRIDKKLAILPRPLSLKPLVAGIVLASVIGTGGYVYNQSELTPDEQATQTSEEVEALKPQNSLLTQLGIELVDIPAGSFMMGSNNGDDEKPVHRVTVPAFKMMKHEVTQGQWEAIMGSNPAFFSNCGSKCPIEAISWNDVQTFIQKLNQQTGMNFRLPSEAEWEYAARAGTTTTFSTGDRISTSQANFDGRYTYNGSSEGQYREKTLPVGSFQPNDFGLYDMHGNVWEWTQDCWNESYSGWFSSAPEDASAWLSGDCDKRVLRGGSLSDVPGLLRSANRYGLDAASRSYVYGFRLVQGQ